MLSLDGCLVLCSKSVSEPHNASLKFGLPKMIGLKASELETSLQLVRAKGAWIDGGKVEAVECLATVWLGFLITCPEVETKVHLNTCS